MQSIQTLWWGAPRISYSKVNPATRDGVTSESGTRHVAPVRLGGPLSKSSKHTDWSRPTFDRQTVVNYPTLLAHGFAVRFVEGGAFAWTPVLAAVGGRLIIAIHVQRPAIQTHVYGCASARRRLRRAEMLQTDVLRRVVVGVHFVAALLATEPLLRLAVLAERRPALGTPLGGVSGTHLFDRDTEHLGFVLGHCIGYFTVCLKTPHTFKYYLC